jgi:hypothetical protein
MKIILCSLNRPSIMVTTFDNERRTTIWFSGACFSFKVSVSVIPCALDYRESELYIFEYEECDSQGAKN